MNNNSISSSRHLINNIKTNLKNFIPKKFREELMESCARIRDFDPISTLHCFLFQSIEGVSCKTALASLNVSKIKNNLKTVSMNTSGYCKARKKLNEKTLLELVKYSGKVIEQDGTPHLWKKRVVKIADGTIIKMNDTPENQLEYPQSKQQKKGLGWPLIRLVGVFGHYSGAVLDFETGTYAGKGQGEPSLLRRMIKRFSPGDILILDRFFTSFFLHHDFIKQGTDVVVRIKDHVGKKLLNGCQKEKKVNIKRPNKRNCPDGRDYENYDKQHQMRITKSCIRRKGFRTTFVYIMTSLLNEKKYPRKDIEELYGQRWNIELDFRNLKTTIKAEHLLQNA